MSPKFSSESKIPIFWNFFLLIFKQNSFWRLFRLKITGFCFKMQTILNNISRKHVGVQEPCGYQKAGTIVCIENGCLCQPFFVSTKTIFCFQARRTVFYLSLSFELMIRWVWQHFCVTMTYIMHSRVLYSTFSLVSSTLISSSLLQSLLIRIVFQANASAALDCCRVLPTSAVWFNLGLMQYFNSYLFLVEINSKLPLFFCTSSSSTTICCSACRKGFSNQVRIFHICLSIKNFHLQPIHICTRKATLFWWQTCISSIKRCHPTILRIIGPELWKLPCLIMMPFTVKTKKFIVDFGLYYLNPETGYFIMVRK